MLSEKLNESTVINVNILARQRQLATGMGNTTENCDHRYEAGERVTSE